jgi:alpha-ribazole phosphatase
VLILLRHGRTPNNAQARLQGQFDSPLDDVGREQAALAGEYLRRRFDVQRVITSALVRAQETAACAGFTGDGVEIDDRWREIDFGEYDDRRIGDVITELTARWRADPDYVPGGGESMTTMHERVVEACVELAPAAADEDVLVVTHATPIKSAAVWAMGGTASMMMNLWVNLATVSVVDHVHGEFMLREFNTRIDHLR